MSEEVQPVSLMRDTQAVLTQQQLPQATSQVQYVSAGHCLIIGDVEQSLAVAIRLSVQSVTIVHVSTGETETKKRLTDDGIAVFTVPSLSLTGYLGAFKAAVPAKPGGSDFDIGVSVYLETGLFDLVLDLSTSPLLAMRLSPFGYRHATTEEAIDAALHELSQMIGEFDKPRYFDYNPSICAHSRSQLNGCTQCIDVCTTGAIVSSGEGVLVDPFLCQGCGSCATLCPSGAMSYAFPRPANAIERSREALLEHSACVLLLHTESHQDLVDQVELDVAIVPMLVEEVSAFGIDYWLAMLAGHACRIALLSDAESDDPNLLALQGQMLLLHELLSGLGVDEIAVRILSGSELQAAQSGWLDPQSWQHSALRAIKPAEFETHNDKRQTIRMSLDALSAEFTPLQSDVSLSGKAPFGQINVDTQACTLCMACVSTCPAKALLDGQDTPALRFVEANCLQCGLCEQACPESAISLDARYVWDSIEARRISPLHEEEPFNCLMCYTPFTTKAMIETMSSKLASHWMFQDEKALRRLRLCGDCRVRDMFEQDSSGIDVHNGQE